MRSACSRSSRRPRSGSGSGPTWPSPSVVGRRRSRCASSWPHPGGARVAGARRPARRPSLRCGAAPRSARLAWRCSHPSRSAPSPPPCRHRGGRGALGAALGAAPLRPPGGRRGWSLYSEALRHAGRPTRCSLGGLRQPVLRRGDGRDAGAAAGRRPGPVRTSTTLPGGVLLITPEEMPGLRAVLDEAWPGSGRRGCRSGSTPRAPPRRGLRAPEISSSARGRSRCSARWR
jgi:hypothetical protein